MKTNYLCYFKKWDSQLFHKACSRRLYAKFLLRRDSRCFDRQIVRVDDSSKTISSCRWYLGLNWFVSVIFRINLVRVEDFDESCGSCRWFKVRVDDVYRTLKYYIEYLAKYKERHNLINVVCFALLRCRGLQVIFWIFPPILLISFDLFKQTA